MSDNFIIYDLEYTTWDGAQERRWSGDNERREIVQIGAIKIDRQSLEEVGQLNILIKPRINPELSNYFCELTGISQEQVNNNGISIEDALQQFNDFAAGLIACSNGNDMVIIGENIGYIGKPKLFPSSVSFLNIDYWFYNSYEQSDRICSGDLADHFGLNVASPDDKQVHNALYDCRSLLATIKHILETGQQDSLPF